MDPKHADQWINDDFEGHLLWLDESELENVAARNQVNEALDSGLFVLLTSRHAHRSLDAHTFGFQADTRRAAYHRTADGELEVGSVADDVSPADAASFLSDWVKTHDRSASPAQGAARRTAPETTPLDGFTSSGYNYTPKATISQSKMFADGRLIKYDITVTRDVAGADRKFVTVRTTILQKPVLSGAYVKDKENPQDTGTHLWIPSQYDVMTSVMPVGEPTRVELASFIPTTEGATKQTHSWQIIAPAAEGGQPACPDR